MKKLRLAKLVSTDSFHCITWGPWRTGQTQRAEEDLHALLPNNPFVPPKGDICFINNLPPELLSRIFEVGSADNDSEDDDDVGVDPQDSFRYNFSSAKGAAGKDSHGSHVEMQVELDDEEIDDEEDSDPTGSSDFPPPRVSFQIVISHVCRHWRNVALSTPSLWTNIEVAPEARPPYESVSTRLERSKGLPIDIYVNCGPPAPDVEPPSDADLEFLFSLLCPHIHRWRTMEALISSVHHMYVLLSL